MPEVTYHGPSARLRVRAEDGQVYYLRRSRAVDVPQEVVDQAVRKCGDRVSVHGADDDRTVDGLPTGVTETDRIARFGGQEDDDQ